MVNFINDYIFCPKPPKMEIVFTVTQIDQNVTFEKTDFKVIIAEK